MRSIVVVVMIILGCNSLQTRTDVDSVGRMLTHAYDSIRIEMIKTTCNICNDSALLKDISEGRVDTVLKNSKSSLARLIRQSDKKFSGADLKKCDMLARTMRANLMGRLLIRNYKNEDSIVCQFGIHKKGLDSLLSKVKEYMEAKNSDTDDLRNFDSLLKSLKGTKNIVIVVFLVVVVVLAFLVYRLRKRNNTASASQQGRTDNPQGQEEQSCVCNLPNGKNNIDTRGMEQTNASSLQPSQSADVDKEIYKSQATDSQFDATKANCFVAKNDNCIVVGASVIGKSHISSGLPCQDNCRYAYIKNGWGIAITSDGAGSAKRSDIGSRIVVERGIVHFKAVIEKMEWIENGILPTDDVWTNVAYTTLEKIKDDMEKFATKHHLELDSLNATAIVVIHTPFGFLTTHVGDGRAGYKDDSNEWKALIAPHKGEEANQTIFMTSGFWGIPYYVMSDVMVPESHVVRCNPVAFTLMSDGCEHTSWSCCLRDEKTGICYYPNKPFGRFFDPLIEKLVDKNNTDLGVLWARFINSGNDSFEKESDDKTMILGVIEDKDK